MKTNEKACPYCAEVIKAQAIVCRFCNRDLPSSSMMEVAPQQPTADQISELIDTAPSIKENHDDPDSLTGAAWQGKWATVKTLIANGADVSKPNSAGHTALDLARARRDKELVRLLLTPAKPTNADNQKFSQTPLTGQPLGVSPAQAPANRVPCPSCGELVTPSATLCPFCKQAIFSKDKGMNAIAKVVAYVVTFLVLFYAISAFTRHEADKAYKRITGDAQEQTEEMLRNRS
ncbi:MAG: zinc ribbon domain-containing protein [Polaromonas sp.]|nr:zinc ribbon domain-containing protein [Polaromonas sp.]